MRAYIIYIYSMAFSLLLTAVGCSSQKNAEATPKAGLQVARDVASLGNVLPGTTAQTLPKAVVYKTSHDYADRVPVTMNEARTAIASFPDPSDLKTADGYAKPIALQGDYLLDRRGVNAHTAFLDYTYEEYAALPSVPTLAELKAHLLDTHPIKELYALPITASEALADTARCNAYIASGFAGCKSMVVMPPSLK